MEHHHNDLNTNDRYTHTEYLGSSTHDDASPNHTNDQL